MKRGTKGFALAILTVIAAALALWALSPRIVEGMVTSALRDRGFDNVAVNMSRPGLDSVRVHRLSFDMDDGATSVSVEGVELEYALPGLVEGRVRSLAAEAVEVTRRQADAAAAPLALPAALPDLDPAPLLAVVPAGGIAVSRLTVSTGGGEPIVPPVSLEVTRGDDGASALAVARPLDPAAADRAFEIVADSTGRINGALAWDDASVSPALEFSLMRADTPGAWSGRVSGDAAALGEWLAPLTESGLPLSDCRLEAAVRLDDNPLDALHLDADLSGCRAGFVDFASGSVRGRFMRTAAGIASVTPVRVSLETTAAPGLEARSLVLASGVDVDLEDGIVALPAGATLRAAGVTAGDIGAGELVGTLRESLRVNLAAPRGRAIVEARGAGVTWRGDPLEFRDTLVELTFDSEGFVLPSASAGQISMDSGDLSVTASSIVARPDGGAMAITTPRVAVARAEARATVENLDATVPLRGDGADTFEARADSLVLDAEGYRARLNAFAARGNWRGGGVDADFDARLADAMPVNGRLELDAASPSGRLAVEGAPVTFGEDIERASLLVDGWPAGIDLVDGRAGFSVDVAWDAGGVVANARVDLDGAGGVARDVYFSDAATTLALEVYPGLRTTAPARVSVGTVDYGLALTGIEATVAVEGMDDGVPRVAVSDARAEAFDGVVRVAEFTSAGRSFDVRLENVDLARLVGEDRFPGLSMSGRVGGRVPVEIRDDGVYINRGLVESTGGGVLHYDPGNVGAGSGAEILFRALKEFEYSVLRVEPEYRPDGTLKLAVHMEGTSAELGRDQPIHFNVNVEQNVLRLLESIRLVDGLNDRIDRGVQQFYQRRQ